MSVVESPIYVGTTLVNFNELGNGLVYIDFFTIFAIGPATISTITFYTLAEKKTVLYDRPCT